MLQVKWLFINKGFRTLDTPQRMVLRFKSGEGAV